MVQFQGGQNFLFESIEGQLFVSIDDAQLPVLIGEMVHEPEKKLKLSEINRNIARLANENDLSITL